MLFTRATFLVSPLISFLTMPGKNPDIAVGAAMFGIASKEQVLPLAKHQPNTIKSSGSMDFETRSAMFGIASKEQVLPLAKLPNTIILDVRTGEEIKSTGSLESKYGSWVHSIVALDAVPELQDNAEAIVGSDKDAPIIIYCGSGKRARKAKEVLESKGYTKVLNAGSWDDIDYLK